METETDLANRFASLNIVFHNEHEVLYKYVSAEVAMKILSNGNLKFSGPNEFNDPFELNMGLLDLTEPYPGFLKEYFEKHPIPSNSDIQLGTILQEFGDDYYQNLLLSSFRRGKNNIGILCLSKTKIETLMWSHYSDKHKGVCLGFKFPQIDAKKDLYAFKVNYVDKIKPVRYFNNGDADTASTLYWMLTKSKRWKYEDEVRVIKYGMPGLIPFEKEQLVEVFFGVATPKNEIESINSLLKSKQYSGIKIAKMKIDNSTFDLSIS